MNYRHIYHAGNFADVFKHAVLCYLLDYLSQKDKPFCYIDSHAGIGLYDLHSDEATRSPEHQQGIAKLLAHTHPPAEWDTYLHIVRSFQKNGELNCYPGSPLIAAHFLREQDKLILNEWHPQDYLTLKKTMSSINTAHCHQRDAYEFLPASLPPTPKRGLILIDPPYEKRTEFQQLINVLEKCMKRFETGIYMVWYPIVDHSHQPFVQQIKKRFTAVAHYEVLSRTQSTGLLGCGIMIINPPWNSDPKIKALTERFSDLF